MVVRKAKSKKQTAVTVFFSPCISFSLDFMQKPNGEKKPNNNVATVIATEVSHFLVFMFFTTLTFSLPTL